MSEEELELLERPGSTRTISEGDATFHCGLQTFVNRIEYTWSTRFGAIFADGPVDMSGSIKLFEAIDPNVTMIVGYIDDSPDVLYEKHNSRWDVRRRKGK